MKVDLVTEQIIAICIGGILWVFIYTPLLIFHGLRYYENRNHMYVCKLVMIIVFELTAFTLLY